jgi:signal transduction histidine kinase
MLRNTLHHIIIRCCLLLFLLPIYVSGQDWEQVRNLKKAEIDVYWFTSVPFIYADQNGELAGVEYEMMMAFKDYLKRRYQVDITLNWIEAESFSGIMDRLKETDRSNQFGVSAFSITEERLNQFQFSSPYLPDITVLVSSQGTPIVQNYEELRRMINGMEAITIKGTNYERMLQNLRTEMEVPFEISYIESDKNILENIGQAGNRFGFIDLPIYMMLIKDGGGLIRQNLFTERGTGYGIIMPKKSDWHIPFNNFLSDPVYKKRIGEIISDHLGMELFQFIDNIYGDDQISTSILTKEKELQLEQIRNANLKLEQEQSTRRLLITWIVIIVVFLIVTGGLYLVNRRKKRLLMQKNRQIEAQQRQLVNRNAQLTALNEEKNNLVKILAHDLRSPLSQIIMLADILGQSSNGLSEEDKGLLGKIGTGATHLNQLITKILDGDVLEGKPLRVMREQLDVPLLMIDIVERYRPMAESKQISLKVFQNLDKPLIQTDHLLLLQVLENLVSNALKFSPPGTTVSLEAETKQKHVLFKVTDQGPGFTEEDKKMAFGKFQKLSAKPTGGETSLGLGLSIVKKYAADLGGEVWLESKEGMGSAFFVRLPV